MTDLEDYFNQVYRMALAAWQSHYYWMHTDSDSPREDVIKEYGTFFYATNEAHITMMVISIDCLITKGKSEFINFETLLSLLEGVLPTEYMEVTKQRIDTLQKNAQCIKIMRNNSYAHITRREKRISDKDSRNPTREEILNICYQTIYIATDIGHNLGIDLPVVDDILSADKVCLDRLYCELEDNI